MNRVAPHTDELFLPSGSEHLPVHRQRLEAVCRIAMGEPNILGVLIGGSFASGEADIYSDLDMQFVIEDQAGEAAAGQLRRLAEKAGPLVAAFLPTMGVDSPRFPANHGPNTDPPHSPRSWGRFPSASAAVGALLGELNPMRGDLKADRLRGVERLTEKCAELSVRPRVATPDD